MVRVIVVPQLGISMIRVIGMQRCTSGVGWQRRPDAAIFCPVGICKCQGRGAEFLNRHGLPAMAVPVATHHHAHGLPKQGNAENQEAQRENERWLGTATGTSLSLAG